MRYADKAKVRDVHLKIKKDVIDLCKETLGKVPDWVKFDENEEYIIIKVLAMSFYTKTWEYYTFLRPTIKNIMEHREKAF